MNCICSCTTFQNSTTMESSVMTRLDSATLRYEKMGDIASLRVLEGLEMTVRRMHIGNATLSSDSEELEEIGVWKIRG